MKLRMDKTLRFWIDVAYDEIKMDHDKVPKQHLLAHILRQYEGRGDAMRYLDKRGTIAWKASPRFLTKLADGARSQPTDIYGGGVGALVKGALAYLERRNSMGRGQEATDG
jgi:hypothetical protein